MAGVGADWLEIETAADMANGDGLTYTHKRRVVGIQANRVASRHARLWRVWPNEALAELPGLGPGVAVTRNRDHAWEQRLARASATRRIGVRGRLGECSDGLIFSLTDSDGYSASACLSLDHQAAQDAAQAEASLREQLGRFGNSDFELTELHLDWQRPWFVPASLGNRLRRDALAALAGARAAAYMRPLRRPVSVPAPVYPETALTYLANVYNDAARAFYARHGVTLIEAAYEAHAEAGEVSLMITRHCLRYAFNLCPKQAKGVIGVQGQVRAEPMTLVNGQERLNLTFDCRACEMHVRGRIRRHILNGPAPTAVPVSFHPRRTNGAA